MAVQCVALELGEHVAGSMGGGGGACMAQTCGWAGSWQLPLARSASAAVQRQCMCCHLPALQQLQAAWTLL